MSPPDVPDLEEEKRKTQLQIDKLREEAFPLLGGKHGAFDMMTTWTHAELKTKLEQSWKTIAQVRDPTPMVKNRPYVMEKLIPLKKRMEQIDAQMRDAKAKKQSADAFAYDGEVRDAVRRSSEEQLGEVRRQKESAWRKHERKPEHQPLPFGKNLARRQAAPGGQGSRLFSQMNQTGDKAARSRPDGPVGQLLRGKLPLESVNKQQTAPPRRRAVSSDAVALDGLPSSSSDRSNDVGERSSKLHSPTTRSKRAAQKPDAIEILDDSDDEGAAARGGVAAHAAAELPIRSTRPTRSTVKLSVPQRIGNISAVYPVGSVPEEIAHIGTVEVTSRDLLTLDDGEFLNDNVIEFFIKKLQMDVHAKHPEDLARCHIFNSFFYEKLTNDKGIRDKDAAFRQKEAHERVRKWTRDVNIFEKDFVFFPIHSNLHWSLVILCHPNHVEGNTMNLLEDDSSTLVDTPYPCLLHLDSMSGGHRSAQVCNRLREYLAMEWLKLHEDEASKYPRPREGEANLLRFTKEGLEHKRMKVPQQDNGCDCGVFVLSFLQRFFQPHLPKRLTKDEINAAYKDFKTLRPSPLRKNFLRPSWFVPEEAALQRSEITRDMIMRALLESVGDPENVEDPKRKREIRLQLENIGVLLQELEVRVEDRQLATTEAERRVEKKLEEKRRRLEEKKAAAEAGKTVAFSGKGHSLRDKVLRDEGNLSPMMFYGGLDQPSARAKGRPIDGKVDLTAGDEPNKMARPKRKTYLADTDSEDEIAIPKDSPSRHSRQAINSNAAHTADDAVDSALPRNVDDEVLQSETESDGLGKDHGDSHGEEVQAKDSSRPARETGLKTAAIGAVETARPWEAARNGGTVRKRTRGDVSPPSSVRRGNIAVERFEDFTFGRAARKGVEDAVPGSEGVDRGMSIDQIQGVVNGDVDEMRVDLSG
jgi:hypothetical protein